MTPRPARGMALLIVLLITAMISLIVSRMQTDWQLRYQQTRQNVDAQQAKWLLLGSEAVIQRRQQASLPSSPPPSGLQQLRLDDVPIHYQISDGQSCYNLNAITASTSPAAPQAYTYSQRVFFTLLQQLGVEDARADTLTQALTDWVDPDVPTVNNPPEAQAYQHHQPALTPANRMLLDVSEIRVLNSMDRDLYQRLTPLVCALPDKQLRVNLNALTRAQLPLLQALLLGEITAQQAASLLAARPDAGWGDDRPLPPLPTLSQRTRVDASSAIVWQSEYFYLDQWLGETLPRHQLRTFWQHRAQRLSVLNRHYTFE